MGRLKSISWFIFCLLGLSGFGVIVAEVLKKWHFISEDLSVVWVVAPILILYIVQQATQSSYVRRYFNLSSHFVSRSRTIINIILVILGVFALISLPFLWYGVIEELASQKH
ncbi:MAG: hypothetical protein QNJ26_11850 [Desulfobacterales bacterium]|nr:hypothetical protein [Desulfobacterales bacterium]